MAGFRVFQHPENYPRPRFLPLGVSQTYDAGDPLYILNEQLTVTPKDASKALVGELFGFASEGALGNQSNTRQNLSYGNGNAGADENTMRAFYPPTPGLLMATSNFWTSAAGTTQDTIAGTDLGELYQMASAVAGDWGLLDAAGVDGTDAVARIVSVYDPEGNPFTADTAETTCGPGLVTIIFEIVGTNLFTLAGA